MTSLAAPKSAPNDRHIEPLDTSEFLDEITCDSTFQSDYKETARGRMDGDEEDRAC